MFVTVIIPVYRDGARAICATETMLRQALHPGDSLEVVVVDDGSGDGTAEYFATFNDPRVRLLELPCNLGRSGARNAGAAIAQGSVVVFMDCDCLPTNEYFVATHVLALRDAVASTGRVTGNGAGFWDRYQRDASLRRERHYAAGAVYAGSSTNLAVRVEVFNAIGGFDVRYRKYGFEDRDLLLRLARQGHIAWNRDAEVMHMDALTLREVSGKMRDAGRCTSVDFSRDHPGAYRALGYAGIDARQRPWLRPAAKVAGALAPAMARVIDRMGILERLPYPAASLVTKVISAMSYLAGTADSRMRI